MVIHFFLLGLARMLLYAPAYGLFLTDHSANRLPLVYISVSILATLLSVLYLRAAARVAFPKLMALNLGTVILLTLASRGALAVGGSWATFSLPIVNELVYVLVNLAFWALAARLFDARTGKRLFGLLIAAKQLSEIVGGLLTPALASSIGSENLLFVSAGASSVAAAVLVVIVRRFPGPLRDPEEADGSPGAHTAWRGLFRSRYVVLMVA
ncbi:MAG: ATP/ADP translocase [Myxococcota bacterium]|jgi:ATP/ADP translocase